MTRTLRFSALLGVALSGTSGAAIAQEPNPTFSIGVVAINNEPVQGAPVSTVTVEPGDTINAELYVRDWSPLNDELRAYQFQLDESGFTSGDSGSIKPVGYDQSLANDADNPAGAFIDLSHPMFVHAGRQTIALTDTKNARGYRWLSVLVDIAHAPVSPQDGTWFYCGSVNLAVSSDAAGEFEIAPVPDPQITGLLKDNNRAISPIDYQGLTVRVKSGVVRYRIVETSPRNGAIDPRIFNAMPSTDPLGWRTFDLKFDAATVELSRDDFQLSDGSADPPGITDLVIDGPAVTLTLDRPIRVGAWTTLTYKPSGFATKAAALPGDVNGDGTSDSRDVLVLLEALNGKDQAGDGADVTGDGKASVLDSFCLIDLLTARLNRSLDPA